MTTKSLNQDKKEYGSNFEWSVLKVLHKIKSSNNITFGELDRYVRLGGRFYFPAYIKRSTFIQSYLIEGGLVEYDIQKDSISLNSRGNLEYERLNKMEYSESKVF
jgi:hypothetical protein